MASRCGLRPPRRRAWLTVLGAALAAVVVVGCGESADEKPTLTTEPVKIERVARDRWTWARARFNEMCAGCHTLADAGARGRRFNLDADPDINDQLIREIMLGGGPGMPPFASSISYREFEQITLYLLAVAGREEGLDAGWRDQIELRREGEHERPPGWPARRWLTVPRYNP